VVIMTSVAFERERRLSVLRLVVPQSLAIRVISRRRSQVSIGAHLAIAVIGVEWTLRRVNRDVIEVNTEPVSLSICIREQAALEHLVRREANSGNHIRRGEGGLLHLCEVVFRITIELHYANFDQWVVSLGPDFGQIKRIVLVCLCLFLCHYLDEERPTRKISRSIASNRSRPLLSRSFATTAAAASSVRFSIPCCERKWNFTQVRLFSALIIEKV